jgi:hypothetical protein
MLLSIVLYEMNLNQVRQLESQNALLKEKSVEARKENDILVEKIQNLTTRSRMSTEVAREIDR